MVFYFKEIDGVLTAHLPEDSGFFVEGGYLQINGYEQLKESGHLIYTPEELAAIFKLLDGVGGQNSDRDG